AHEEVEQAVAIDVGDGRGRVAAHAAEADGRAAVGSQVAHLAEGGRIGGRLSVEHDVAGFVAEQHVEVAVAVVVGQQGLVHVAGVDDGAVGERHLAQGGEGGRVSGSLLVAAQGAVVATHQHVEQAVVVEVGHRGAGVRAAVGGRAGGRAEGVGEKRTFGEGHGAGARGGGLLVAQHGAGVFAHQQLQQAVAVEVAHSRRRVVAGGRGARGAGRNRGVAHRRRLAGDAQLGAREGRAGAGGEADAASGRGGGHDNIDRNGRRLDDLHGLAVNYHR
nr:hypothetical protein [Tanacetum cinerariifolium]